MANVTSWFIDQLNSPATEPVRVFTMAGSDHSSNVKKWPKIRRNIEEIKPVNLNISLKNTDGLYNSFYESLYTINASCHIDIGFTHPTSGDEFVRVYTGMAEKVRYDNELCNLYINDKIYDLSLRKVGSTESHVDFSSQIPSEIVWTLCTCYGGLSSVQDSSNTDIDYPLFSEWAETFSIDSIVATANFQGELVVNGIKEIVDYTDSFHWIDGDGKLVFQRFSETSSLDFVLEEGNYKNIKLDVDAGKIINKQFVDWNYSVSSEYWQNQNFQVNSTSVNSYRIHESVMQSENVWYTNSSHATNLAARRLSRLAHPPKYFTVSVPLFGLHRAPGETLRLVNSFYNVNSSSGWRISAQEIDVDAFAINFSTNEALVANAFYLDESDLDGDDLLL